MDLGIKQLGYFLVLSKALNFGRAARELGIAQPTLSFQIKSLENTLGVKLFDRSSRAVHLTREGERLQPHARAIIEHADAAFSSIQAPVSLTISCGAVGKYVVLSSVLRELATKAPQLDIRILDLTPEEMKTAATDGTVDVLLMTPDWKLPGMEFQLLKEELLSAAVPLNHPAARRGSISVEEFSQQPILIIRGKDCHKHRGFVTGLLANFGCTANLIEAPIKGGIQFAMVAAGTGVALVAHSLSTVKFPGVAIIPFDREIHNMQLGIMWRTNNDSPAIRIFRTAVEEVMRKAEAPLKKKPATLRLSPKPVLASVSA
jgi:DNA-binding transcriptional LysR family regulator